MADYVHPDVLVSTEWVAEHLSDPSVRIVESNEDRALYTQGHISGAVEIDWQVDLQDQVCRDYIGREDFEKLCSLNGISNDTTVVLYGEKQLVGLLCILGIQTLRPRQLPDHERRPKTLATRRAGVVERSSKISPLALHSPRAGPLNSIAP